MKTPFLDYWTKRKERGEILENRFKIKLTPEQILTLLRDSDVRGALQKNRVASLLPPVGSDVFRRFTQTSLEQIEKCKDSKKNKQVQHDSHTVLLLQAEEDCLLKPAPELESEKTLPFFYSLPPPELRNVPLEDPDPFYQSKKTFVVVDSDNILTRFNAESSCYHFSPFSLFRRVAIKILNHKLFTALLCVALLVNIFILNQPQGLLPFILEWVFLSLYTFEAVLKILSRGFCLGRFTYLRDSWNRLDFVIITTGFAFMSLPELWFFRTLRIIKILGLFPATRRNAKLFGRVLNRLWDVLLLTLLVLSVFSIIGMGVLMGSLGNKCVRWAWGPFNSSDALYPTDFPNATEEFNYKAYVNDPAHYYYSANNPDPLTCGNSSTASTCPEGYICLRTSTNPHFGFTSYDHFGYSFLATFRLMTRDFWENLAQLAAHTEGEHIMIYFAVVLFICSFSLTAFIVAAFIISFTEQTEREIKEVEQDKKDYDEILAVLKDKGEDELLEKKDPEPKISCWRRLCSCDCCSCWVRLKKGLQFVVLDPFFDLAIIILIILNVIFSASIHYPMTWESEDVLAVAQLTFTLIFFLEVVLKILALGPYQFFKVNWHYYDTVIAVMSVVELGVASIGFSQIGHLFCFLRLFRLARWWPGFLKWLRLVWAGLCSLWMVSLVLVSLFFSMFGTAMFSESFKQNVCRIADDCELPRWHLYDFFHSLMTVTRALLGEWIETLWICLGTSNQFVCLVFYVSLLIVGNFLILTLFFTLLMKWISDKMAPKDEEQMKTSKIRFVKMLKVCGINAGGETKEEERAAAAEDAEGMALNSVTAEQPGENGTQSSTLPIGEAQNFQKMKEAEEAREDPEDCCPQKCSRCCPSLNESQGCGRVWAKVRRAAFNIVQHPYFNNFIFFIVLISSLALVCEDMYLPKRPTLQVVLGYFDQVITYLFVVEVLFKWIGHGFSRYFRDGWCWLEFIVTLACVLSLAAQTSSLSLFLISLKALRPLRILAHIKGTRRSMCVLLKLVPSLLDGLLVSLTVWLFFVMLGIDLYAGRFYSCINDTSGEIFSHHDVANKTECIILIEQNFTEVRWKNSYFNFDNAHEAYFSLFSVATLKGWLDILYSMMDSVWIEDQPFYEASLNSYVFVLLFFLFGCFFCFIHIFKLLFDSYSSQTQKITGGSHLLLTETQMKDFDNLSFRLKRPLAPCPRPQGRLLGRLFDLVSHECFEGAMLGVILFSVVLLMIERYDATKEEEEVLYYLHFVVLLLFLLEFILKICAYRRSYFRDNLNTIDFVVLILQIIALFLFDLIYIYFMNPTPLHLLRLGRFSRIIHRFPGALRLRLLFSAWTKSLRAIFNLALLLFVLMFVYASFGTFHFYQVQETAFITNVFNFKTFGSALSCMFTASTWASWDGMIRPILFYPPDCTPDSGWSGEKGDCASPGLGVAFFLSFLCLSSYVVLMMVLVVLVDMLNVFGVMRCDPLSVVNLSHFFKTWRKFAPDSSQFIQRSQLPDLCDKLKKPLRIPKPTELDLKLKPEEQLHCRDVLLALSIRALGDGADRDALKGRIDEKYNKYMPSSPSQESCEMTNCTLQMDQEEATATPVTEVTEA